MVTQARLASTFAIVAALFFSGEVGYGRESRASDHQVKAMMIHESRANYPGNCPCPYDTDRAGRSCGGRSAWSRPGGYAPLCYDDDITPSMLATYRADHGL